jgi:4-amino-4-deoxy-L-arabinose transferase-like glycosyltransferase
MSATARFGQDDSISVSLVVDRSGNTVSAAEAVEQAEVSLQKLGSDYEILLVGPESSQPLASEIRGSRRVQGTTSADGFTGALRSALTHGRGRLIAYTDGSVDVKSLAYVIPLAEHYPVVWGGSQAGGRSWGARLVSNLYNAVTRALLLTGVDDCQAGVALSVFQRAALAEVLPEADGPFAPAEILARARHRNLPVAEVPVPRAGMTPARRLRLGSALAACLRFWWSRLQFGGLAPARARRQSWLGGILLAIVAALVLFPNLNQPLLDPDEGRQAEIPREMLAHHDLQMPRMLGEPYYEKPPLQYWLTAGAYRVFGLRSGSARLVPATAAWLAVVFSFAWARRTLGARPAFLGGLGLCLTPGFVVLGRTVVLDSLLALCVVTSWYTAYLAVSGPTLRRGWWVLSALVCGLGILAKGPVALVLLAPPVLVYQWLASTTVRPRWGMWLLYAALAAGVAAPWYVEMELRDSNYVWQFLWRANLVRYVSPFDHEQPWWFYLPVLFVATLPWSFLWPPLIYFLSSRSPRLAMLRTPALGFAVLTVGWCFLFYSLAGCKSPPYMAPALAPLALVIGACIDAILFYSAGRRDSFLGLVRQTLPARLAPFILLLSGGCYLTTSFLDWQPWGWALTKALLSLAFLAVWWFWGRRSRPVVAWGLCAGVMLAFVTLAMRDVMRGYASRHSPAPIAELLRKLPDSKHRPVISYRRQWNSASFYLRRDVVLCFDEQHRESLLSYLSARPKTLVLVESGTPLEEFLSILPSRFTTEVHHPKKEGQAALVVVRAWPASTAHAAGS